MMMQDGSVDQMCGPLMVEQTVGFGECYRKSSWRYCDFGYSRRGKDQYREGSSLARGEKNLDVGKDRNDRFLPVRWMEQSHCTLQ